MPGYDDSLCQAARMCPFSGLPCWKTKAHRTAQGFKNGPLSFPPPPCQFCEVDTLQPQTWAERQVLVAA